MTPKEAADILRYLLLQASRDDTIGALDLAIEALDPWQPPRAIIPWVDVNEHPHPIDGTWFIARYMLAAFDGFDYALCRSSEHNSVITHWCLLPETP